MNFRLILTVFCTLLLIATSRAKELSWIHRVRDVLTPRTEQFRLRTVASEADHLVGTGTYHEKGRSVDTRLDGIETSDGRFWPKVKLETADQLDGAWTSVEPSSVLGRSASVDCKFSHANVTLYVNLDSFRATISKARFGRISLSNGAATVFELTSLLGKEPASISETGDWDTTTLSGYLENPLAQGPFVVAGISSKKGRLILRGSYFDPHGTSDAVIEGTETPKEYASEKEFWANATLQVANDPEGEWKTVGRTPTSGAPAVLKIAAKQQSAKELNVDIDMLRSMIGKFGYGRAVLPNGQAAAFEMVDLLPPL